MFNCTFNHTIMLCLFVLTIPFLVYVVAKLKAEATRIEMEAELTCQTKVSEMTHLSILVLSFSLSFSLHLLTHTHCIHSLPLLMSSLSYVFPLSLSSLCVFLFSIQMQEAEVQFLREQNELQIKRAKDLSNIEVYNYHLCCYCTFNIKHITCTCMYYCIITCMSIYSNRCLSSVHWLVLWVNKL